MKTGSRIAILVLAVAAIVIVFLLFKPSDEDKTDTTSSTAVTTTSTATTTETTKTSATPKEVTLTPGKMRTVKSTEGKTVRFNVELPQADEVHVHGYDITKAVPANRLTEVSFKTDIEGVFEIELHGSEEQIGELVVEP